MEQRRAGERIGAWGVYPADPSAPHGFSPQETGSQKRPPKRVVPGPTPGWPQSPSLGLHPPSLTRGGWGRGLPGTRRSWRAGGRGGNLFWDGLAGITFPCVPALGAAGRAPERVVVRAEAAPGGSYLEEGADVRARVGARVTTPRPGRGVSVGAKLYVRSGAPQ